MNFKGSEDGYKETRDRRERQADIRRVYPS